jgi:hypothetical protein
VVAPWHNIFPTHRANAAGKSVSISAVNLAELLASAEVHESLRKQPLQDLAMKKALRGETVAIDAAGEITGKGSLARVDAAWSCAANGDSEIPTATEVYPDC